MIIQWYIKMYTLVLHWRLNLSLQISLGSATHTLGEVDILCTILLGVYFWTCLQFFIEIGLYLTATEQKIVGTFFETQCSVYKGGADWLKFSVRISPRILIKDPRPN